MPFSSLDRGVHIRLSLEQDYCFTYKQVLTDFAKIDKKLLEFGKQMPFC